jgi:hypothetical protein
MVYDIGEKQRFIKKTLRAIEILNETKDNLYLINTTSKQNRKLINESINLIEPFLKDFETSVNTIIQP